MATELIEAVLNYTNRHPGANPIMTAVDGFVILRSDHEKRPSHLIYRPALCVVLQGAKWTTFGGRRFDLEAGQALVVSVNVPAIGRVVQASPAEPYLGLIIEFDSATMREVLDETGPPPFPDDDLGKGVLMMDFEGPLADCALRLVRLLDTPAAIPVVSPMIMREIAYWLLAGPLGGEIYRVVCATGFTQRVLESVYVLRDRFAESVRVEELARVANMSPSAFHKRFKSLTGTTPVQYQKEIRLLEAKRLLITTEMGVDTISLEVGYESPSHFSREYSRMFGNSPRRDSRAVSGLSPLQSIHRVARGA